MPNNCEGITLSELLEGVTESLKKLKEPLFSKEKLEKTGIVSSFQNFPCTFDICHTKDDGENEETTRIRSELKHILKKRFSSRARGGKVCSGEKYLTYVDVGIEHCVKPIKQGEGWRKACCVSVGVIGVVLALVGVVSIASCFSPPRQKKDISNSIVRQFDGTNLLQKVEMKMNYEEREK